MTKDDILEYIKIVAITMLVTFMLVIVSLGIIKNKVYEEQLNNKNNKTEEEQVDYYLIGILIEKNKYLENQMPEDYKINIKLGMLYELKKDYANAELNYKEAIDKASYNQYSPKYKLSLLYITQGRLDDAQAVMDDIVDKPDEKLIKYKASVYKALGDAYYTLADYEEAISKYKKSLSYLEIIKDKKNIAEVKDCLASSYVYLADVFLDRMEPQNAIFSLKMALSIIDAPILKYKLALLIMNDDPGLAYQNFDEVFKEQPEIINYDTYNAFLLKLADQAYIVGELPQAELYRYKIKKLKEYFKENILSINDIAIEEVEGYLSLNKFFKKYKVNLALKLKNTSKTNIDSLYVFFVVKDGNKIINKYSQRIVNKNSVLGVGFYSPIIFISIPGAYENQNDDLAQEMLSVDIYVAKSEKAYKLLLKTIDIGEKTKKKSHNKFTKWFAKQYTFLLEQITLKLPALFF